MSIKVLGCGGVLIFALPIQAQTVTDTIPEANPARPTVSTPATLTPISYLQFETGSLGATTSPEFDTRIGINHVTKLTVLPRLEFFVQTVPYIPSSFGRAKEIHPGEVFVGAQAVLLPGADERPTIAISYVRRSPAPELDLGTFRESGTILVSQDVAGFHYDGNLIVTEQTQNGARRAQFGQTLSISHAVKKFTISGELWHFTQPYLRSNAVGNLWAISYPLQRNLLHSAKLSKCLTNLTQLSVDTSWYTRYHSSTSPDFGATFPQELPQLANGVFSAIPMTNADFANANHAQALANRAAFHFGFIEQGGSSLYDTLGQLVSDAEVLRVVFNIGGDDVAHFLEWVDFAGNGVQTPLAPLTDPITGLVFPDFNAMGNPLLQTNLIFPVPCEFISPSLPHCAVIRPTAQSQINAVNFIHALTADGLFIGQSQSFIQLLLEMAEDAENARPGNSPEEDRLRGAHAG